MSWIAGAISEQASEIIKGVSLMLSPEGKPISSTVPRDEIMKQAERTLELLVTSLEEGDSEALIDHWAEIGRRYAGQDFPMAEISNTPDLLKRATWTALKGQVEEGMTSLAELVDSMMGVESVLEDCWLVMVQSYLSSRDIKVTDSTARLEALYSLTEVPSNEIDYPRLYRNIVHNVARVTGISRCSLLLFDEEDALRPAASNFVDAMEKLNMISADEFKALRAVISLNGPVILDKGKGNPREIEKALQKYRTPTSLLVPLKSGDKFLGALLLDEGREGEFTHEQIDMAVAVANQAAMAVEKSNLLEELEARLKHMAAVGIVARSMTTYLDPSEQFKSLLEMAITLMGADGGVLMLRNEASGDHRIVASVGSPDLYGSLECLQMVTSWAAEHGEHVLLMKDVKDPRFSDMELKAEGCLISPLQIRDRVIGTICVSTGKQGGRFTGEEATMLNDFAAQAAISIENTQLYDRLQDAHVGTIRSLAAAIEARDPYTVGHSERVTKYAVAIAEEMSLAGEEVEKIRLAGLLHDLGKIGVPDRILNKPGSLTEAEWLAIKMHPTLSVKIIEPLSHLENVVPIVYHHHEHYDGGGYVDGIAGENIPIGARIIAVADSFEAMTSDRPYRKALSREQAMKKLEESSGSQFDPKVVTVFLELLEKTAK